MSFWGELGQGLLSSAGGNLLSGLTGSITNAASQRRAYRHQLDFWNRQNEYNLPVNQRKRLEDAGLNINALGGSLSASGSSQVGLPSISGSGFTGSPLPVGEMSQVNLNGSLSEYYKSAARLNDEKANTESYQRDYLDALKNSLNQSTLNAEQQNRILRVAADIQEATKSNQIELSDQAIDKGAREIWLLWREQQRQDQIDANLAASGRLLIAQSIEALITSSLKEAQRSLTSVQTAVMRQILRMKIVDADVAEATFEERKAATKAAYKYAAKHADTSASHDTWRQWVESIGGGLGLVTDTIDAVLNVLFSTGKLKGAAAMTRLNDAKADEIVGRYEDAWLNETSFSDSDGNFTGGYTKSRRLIKHKK